MATTDPAELPDLTTCYLVTNLPAPDTKRAQEESELSAADVAEVVRLYSLRSWIEQSYKQVKNSLGWAHYQVRKDAAIMAPLAAGVLRLHLLLVGKRRLPRGGRAAGGSSRKRRGRLNLHRGGGEGKKGRSRRAGYFHAGQRR